MELKIGWTSISITDLFTTLGCFGHTSLLLLVTSDKGQNDQSDDVRHKGPFMVGLVLLSATLQALS